MPLTIASCDLRLATDIKPIGCGFASHTRPECGAGGVEVLVRGPSDAPTFTLSMLVVDDSDFTPDHMEFLHEWAEALRISVEVLLARIILATSEGDQYVDKAPEYRPVPRE